MPLSLSQELELLELEERELLLRGEGSSPEQSKVNTPPSAPISPNNMDVTSQGVMRGVGDLFGAPVDLTTMGINSLSGLVNTIGDAAGGMFDYDPPNIPSINNAFMGSDDLADTTAGIANEIGMDVNGPTQLTGADKLNYNASRFGTSALGGGIGNASRVGNATTQIGKALTQPYAANAGRQILNDTIAGAGSGAGITAAENIAPDSVLAQIFGAITGGAGAAGSSRAISSVGNNVTSRIKDAVGMPNNAPRGNALTQLPDGSFETNRTIEDASGMMRMMSSDPDAASVKIKSNNQMADEGNLTRLTPGVASDDVGLGALEASERVRNPVPFMEKDQAIRTDVTDSVSKLKNPDGDIEAPQVFAKEEINKQMSDVTEVADVAQGKLTKSKEQLAELGRDNDALVAPIAAQRGGEGNASKALDDQISGALSDRTTIKNEKFEAAAGDKLVDAEPIGDSVNKIQSELNELSLHGDSGLPAGFVKRVRKLILEDPDSKPGAGGMVSLKDVSKIRGDIGKSISRARKAGNYDLVDNLNTLKSDINKMIDETASFDDAQKYYREEYAPFFGGQYAKKWRDGKYQSDKGVGGDDPSNTAAFFLEGTSNAAADLKKIVDISPDKVAAEAAVERYLAGDLAYRLGGKPNLKTMQNWMADKSTQLDEFPDVKAKFDNLRKNMGNNQAKESDLKAQIDGFNNAFKRAEKDIGVTSRRINKGVLGTLVNQDPDKYVSSIMGSKNRLKQIKELNNLIGNDVRAKEGFKRATTEYLMRAITGTNTKMTSGVGAPIDPIKITNLMKKNEAALSEIYSPKEMRVIRRAQDMMQSFGNINRKAVESTSVAAEKITHKNLKTAVETALRLKWGVLKAGGLMKTIKGAADLLPDGRASKVDRLISRIMLDPDLAVHVLDMPSRMSKSAWNKKLTALVAGSAAAREANDDDDE